MSKEEKRVIPKKNYYILALLLIGTLLLLYFCVNWYQAYEESKMKEPVIASSISEVKEEELSNYLMDNPNIVIYFTSSKDTTIKEFEEEFVDYISEEELRDQIVYVDTSKIEDEKFYDEFTDKYFHSELKNKDVKLDYLPNIIIVREGKVKDILHTYDSKMTMEDVTRFLKENEVVES